MSQQYASPPKNESPSEYGSSSNTKQADIEAYIAESKRQFEAASAEDRATSPLVSEVFSEKATIVTKKQPWWVVKAPNWKRILGFVATYMALPFVTGVMAGIGEIFANELLYRWGWRGAKPISVPGRNNRVFPKSKSEQITAAAVEKRT
ncbi:hypothetical protein GGI25_004280 [Coemansia spiralis]|uniref:Uncharacterized protein n=2 Tax=Coemansia TaxID=4863 RepID=A0A9W8G560_9FUNG|nr:hypothetical protein BX070DRAFT_234931 [Coemansia spiralis]KAJ1990476.1 hypothetical protein EDC05_004016 [Coemansia umbellata]KAJ2620782.1 hypothetical protein GGI26_004677 [Coemansia sp. RSA 1358]KAJ2674628.1 hypothetical protein GGI25_004280 [Coemansia spiralis]